MPAPPRFAVPVVPIVAVPAEAIKTFTALKRQLNEIPSWGLSPNSWDKIQIIYTSSGDEKQAKAFIEAIKLSAP